MVNKEAPQLVEVILQIHASRLGRVPENQMPVGCQQPCKHPMDRARIARPLVAGVITLHEAVNELIGKLVIFQDGIQQALGFLVGGLLFRLIGVTA